MPYPQLDRSRLHIKPLSQRKNKTCIERDHVSPDRQPENQSAEFRERVAETVERIRGARARGRPVMLAMGAHTIKNGLGPVLIRLLEDGWLTHLATNGAGIIHDWEFAFQGQSSEDVRANVDRGEFGVWEETGRFINLALMAGGYEGLGYGESVGAMIQNEGLTIPDEPTLRQAAADHRSEALDRAAAALDFLDTILRFSLEPGWLKIPHPFKRYSAQAAAYRLGISFTGHPMIGHDIIYNHPMNHGAALGRVALRDFLIYAHNVNDIDGGAYMSVGSAVMSPMIFEKSLAMAQNLHLQRGEHIDGHFMIIVDLAESTWDWQRDGEPPMEDPAYYLRYCKTFSRMGGIMRYLSADNRDFLLGIYHGLRA